MKQNDEAVAFKVVLVGDSEVGKSSICMKYVQSFVFQSQKNQEVVKNYNATIKVDNCILNLGIWDTTSKSQYQKLRTLAYAGADAFIIVFSVNNKKSFENATHKWLNQVTKCCPEASVIFVGNKCDLRFSFDQNTDDQAQLIQKDTISQQISYLKQFRYAQCSALTYEGLTEIFLECAKQILDDEKKEKKRRKKAKLLQNCNNCQLV